MRRRLTLAAAMLAAMLQSTHALNPLMQRCCAESLAGCAGGLAKQLAVYPLDRAATRLETKKGAKATNVQQAYRGAGVLMLFALPYAVAFHVPFVLVENALPIGDAPAATPDGGFHSDCRSSLGSGAPVRAVTYAETPSATSGIAATSAASMINGLTPAAA